jgi:2-oxoglutarate dehydrogenase E1 component
MTEDDMNLEPWDSYLGPNLAYIHEQYDRYLKDPDSVEPTFRKLFNQKGAPPSIPLSKNAGERAREPENLNLHTLKKMIAVEKLIWNIRTYGHLATDIDPLGFHTKSDTRLMDPETFNLERSDLLSIPASLIWESAPDDVETGWDAIQRLHQIYTKKSAYEFSHVHDNEEREWLNRQVESGTTPMPLTLEERQSLLALLFRVDQFEQFLHRTFVGQKRFSIEGLDMLVPLINEIVKRFVDEGAKHILIGMAHRGRLNVLAHIMGKPYGKIFSEFHHSPDKDLVPSEGSMGINSGWTGDVKYHLGANRAVKEGETIEARLMLANNPSHLEFVNPVVEGFSRAAQEDRSKPGFPVQDVGKAATVLVHGDAAFPGEGIVAETLNFNKLPGYRNGGTLHIIANNRLGFTTESKDERSTHYASDLAKGFEIPIVHVNADDPEACIAAIRLASEYRIRFKKDFLIDLVGYRRFGHNESDDPEATQPVIYQKVRNHPIVSEIYADKLKGEGIVNDDQIEKMKQVALTDIQEAYEQIKQKENPEGDKQVNETDNARPVHTVRTAVPLTQLQEINRDLLNFPEGFQVYPKLRRILERRANALDEGGKVDWALAEALAFATILADGKPIRISGQDTERGTFAHRHLMLHDAETGETFCPMHKLPQAKASFAIHNSPLSEASVLGFEYGYNVFSPETLVLWEAQFGDFVNAAQVILDQFVASGREKWSQKSSLVLLLPHGYEGQGPDHSNARLERFLQAAAEGNWTVTNITSAVQYFHLIRQQAALTETEQARPLIVMTPKSLLRNPQIASPGSAFSEQTFLPVMEQPGLGENTHRVERLILCSGKVAVDLEEALADGKDWEWMHVVRIEQLYPFPKSELESILSRYPSVKEMVWLQEEPKNMGPWSYMEPRLRSIAPGETTVRYIGRPERSSPASGYQSVHKVEQEQIMKDATRKGGGE